MRRAGDRPQPSEVVRPVEHASPHRVVMFVYPDAQILDVSGPMEVFARAARWLRDRWGHRVPAYTVELVAATPGPVTMSNGLEIVAQSLQDVGKADTFLVTGGIGYKQICEDPALLAWIREQAESATRVGSICTGALILAAAGLLDGRKATTHWAYLDRLRTMAPGCEVDREALYVESGHIFTSAGVTAGIDLALELIERDWGRATSVAVAQELVVYRRRTAGHTQVSPYLEAERRGDRLGQLQLWILDHLGDDLSVDRLAGMAGMSPRHFSRLFRAHLGTTPADYVLDVRLEEARRRLEAGAASLKDVARQCGFADEQNLRRAFRRRLGMVPRDYAAG